jgi:hypothetical protein
VQTNRKLFEGHKPVSAHLSRLAHKFDCRMALGNEREDRIRLGARKELASACVSS